MGVRMNKYVINTCLASVLVLSGCSLLPNKKNKEKDTMIDTTLQTNPSGLQYIILKNAPEGALSAQKGGSVMVHYTGWLEDTTQPDSKGKKFDSSVDRGQPFVFNVGVGQVIAGWDEGVLAMKVGEKRRLIIPAKLGYGSRGAGALIPGNATLIFDVELLKI